MTHKLSRVRFTDRDCAGGCAVALGCFDGVHPGHRAVFAETLRRAEDAGLAAGVFAFSEPPAFFFSTDGGKLLTTPEEKLELIRDCGFDFAVIAAFPDLRELDAAGFINGVLRGELRAACAVCGENFRFGRDRAGGPETLSRAFGTNFAAVPTLSVGGETLSSTLIRDLISKGKIADAASLLGRPYSFEGTVTAGRGDGTRIGFPTANMLPDERKLLPPFGVYVSETSVEGGDPMPSVTDIGTAPTLDGSGTVRLETHVLDFSGSLRYKKLRVGLLETLRPEMPFPSADELRGRIALDVAQASRFHSGYRR